jgi:hypothetical protein
MKSSAEKAPAKNKSPKNDKNVAEIQTSATKAKKHPNLHERSYAAHLDNGPVEPHTKPPMNPLHGPFPVRRKQP